MFRAILAVLTLGVGLSSGCVTDADVTLVNQTVDQISAALIPILQQQDLGDQALFVILNTTCYNTTARELADVLDTKIRACPELINATTVATLKIGELQFSMMFTMFTSMDNFCGCFPAFLGAMAMSQVQFVRTVQDGHYGQLINTAVVCADSIRAAIPLVHEHYPTCGALAATLPHPYLKRSNLGRMIAFIDSGLCSLTNVNVTCTDEKSASVGFKYCMAPAQIGDSDQACERQKCAKDSMNSDCGSNSTAVFLWSANLYDHSIEAYSDCSSAAAIMASILLVFMTSFVSLLM